MNGHAAPYLSIIIPAHNEESRLPGTLVRIKEYLAGADMPYEVILVDDGSRDRTIEVARGSGMDNGGLRVLTNGANRGKGYSVRRGMLAAEGRFVFYSDADLSTPIEELARLLPELEGGADVVVGSRGLAESQLELRQPRHRESLGRLYNLLVKVLVVRGFQDTQCGFKGFRHECVREIFGRQRLDRFAFDVEILHIARRLGYRSVEVPIRWINSPESKVRIMGDASRMLLDLFRIRLYALLGHYN